MAYYKKFDKRRIYKDPSYASCPANMYYRESEKEKKVREEEERKRQERRDEKQRERDAKAKKKQEEHEALMRELNAITKEKYEKVDTSKPREEVSRELHENLKKATKMFVVNSFVVLVSLGAAALLLYFHPLSLLWMIFLTILLLLISRFSFDEAVLYFEIMGDIRKNPYFEIE